MGLIRAFGTSLASELADQWKEFFYCDSLSNDVLIKKGEKRLRGGSSNKRASDNIISNGSKIAINDGQCMIIVDQGKIVEISAEPGEFIYDKSTEPSIFYGGLGKGIVDSFKKIGQRFTFGGDTGHDQRIYYINIKEILGNKYGTKNPIPIRFVDRNIALDIDISVRCFGEYSFKIEDPILFYTTVAGNVEKEYKKEDVEEQLLSELLTAIQYAFGKLTKEGVRYSELPSHTLELSSSINELMTNKVSGIRGIKIVSLGISSITVTDEDATLIKNAQIAAMNRNPNMAAATLVTAQAEAMKTAAGNESGMGAMFGFAGMNMANQTANSTVQNLFTMSNQETTTSNTWDCECGQKGNLGNFCPNCGKQKSNDWYCSNCGTKNTGNFCSNCGNKK